MEIILFIIFIFIGLLIIGLIGKILGFIWAICQWILGGCGNIFGCFLWIIAILIAMMII